MSQNIKTLAERLQEKLTPTEIRLLRLRHGGLTDKGIAEVLGLGHGTIRNYFHKINKKCQLNLDADVRKGREDNTTSRTKKILGDG